MILGEALRQATRRFIDSESPELDAQVLMASVLKVSRSYCYSHPERLLAETELQAFKVQCDRRAAGEPVAYLTGTRGFWTLDLQVAPGVLIPRPETELLVELALAQGDQRKSETGLLVADLGTGSGAIALALATERPGWQVWATELHTPAFTIAAGNIASSSVKNLTLVQGSWCEPLPALGFDIIVANPPYIASDDVHLCRGDVRFEPRSALVADQQGLADIGIIATQTFARLLTDGWLLLEHGWEQGDAVREILARAGFAQVRTCQDTAGLDRVSLGCKRSEADAG